MVHDVDGLVNDMSAWLHTGICNVCCCILFPCSYGSDIIILHDKGMQHLVWCII